MNTIYTTEQMRSPYSEHAASGKPNTTHLEGAVRFVQAQDQQVTTCSLSVIVSERLLTREMLVKMQSKKISKLHNYKLSL